MKKWQKWTLHRTATKIKERIEKENKEELLNLFNSGIVVDLTKLKIGVLEMIVKATKNKR